MMGREDVTPVTLPPWLHLTSVAHPSPLQGLVFQVIKICNTQHHHCHIITISLSHHHYHCHIITITVTSSLFTVTSSLSLSHHHYITVTSSLHHITSSLTFVVNVNHINSIQAKGFCMCHNILPGIDDFGSIGGPSAPWRGQE